MNKLIYSIFIFIFQCNFHSSYVYVESIYMYACSHTCQHRYMCCTCGGLSWCQESSVITFCLTFFEVGSLSQNRSSLMQLVSLAILLVDPLSILLRLELLASCHDRLAFMLVLGMWTALLRPLCQALGLLSRLPSSCRVSLAIKEVRTHSCCNRTELRKYYTKLFFFF